MTSTRRPIADGPEGIAEILRTLNQLRDFYGAQPAIRACAVRIAATLRDNDEAEHVARLARFVRDAVVYVADPLNLEFVQTPERLLLEIQRTGQAFGDCDDHVLLFASLCESLGIRCDIAGVVAPGAVTVNHVIAVTHLGTVREQIDLCAKDGFLPTYSELTIFP